MIGLKDEYPFYEAEEKVKDITKELITIEEKLSKDLRAYL